MKSKNATLPTDAEINDLFRKIGKLNEGTELVAPIMKDEGSPGQIIYYQVSDSSSPSVYQDE